MHIHKGDGWDASPDFGQEDAYTNAPQLLGTTFALYGIFSLISWKKLLARLHCISFCYNCTKLHIPVSYNTQIKAVITLLYLIKTTTGETIYFILEPIVPWHAAPPVHDDDVQLTSDIRHWQVLGASAHAPVYCNSINARRQVFVEYTGASAACSEPRANVRSSINTHAFTPTVVEWLRRLTKDYVLN